MRFRFTLWWHSGYNNAFAIDTERPSQQSVGLGGTIHGVSDALAGMRKSGKRQGFLLACRHCQSADLSRPKRLRRWEPKAAQVADLLVRFSTRATSPACMQAMAPSCAWPLSLCTTSPRVAACRCACNAPLTLAAPRTKVCADKASRAN